MCGEKVNGMDQYTSQPNPVMNVIGNSTIFASRFTQISLRPEDASTRSTRARLPDHAFRQQAP